MRSNVKKLEAIRKRQEAMFNSTDKKEEMRSCVTTGAKKEETRSCATTGAKKD